MNYFCFNFKFEETPVTVPETPATNPVPEPASMALMLSGLVGIGGWKLKNKMSRS